MRRRKALNRTSGLLGSTPVASLAGISPVDLPPGGLTSLPASAEAYFDSFTLHEIGIGSGWRIVNWPGWSSGPKGSPSCDVLYPQRNVVYYGKEVWIGGNARLSASTVAFGQDCRYWRTGENNIFLVFSTGPGNRCALASQTEHDYDASGYQIQMLRGGLAAVTRSGGGDPFVQGVTRVDDERFHLARVHVTAGGMWRLYVDGLLDAEAAYEPLQERPAHRFHLGRPPASGRYVNGFAVGMVLSAGGPVTAGEVEAVEQYAASRWGVTLRQEEPPDDDPPDDEPPPGSQPPRAMDWGYWPVISGLTLSLGVWAFLRR